MLLRNARLSLIAIFALVSLRFLIGYHFFMEGSSKVREGNFSSTGFLSTAKGPLAKSFQSMVPDFDGSVRLDPGKPKEKGDAKDGYENSPLRQAYDQFVSEATALFQFTDEQGSEAKAEVTKSVAQLAAVYGEWKPQIEEYKNGIARIASLERDETRSRVSSLRKQRDDIELKWKSLVKPALYDIDQVTLSLEKKINAIATDAQRQEGKLSAMLSLPSSSPIDVRLVDKILPIFDMSVGILLMLGLLTPVAGLAAGIFLASVVLTQFPGSHGSQPTYYQAIEMVGCFFLAFSDAGRYAGLDFLPWSFWNRNRDRRK